MRDSDGLSRLCASAFAVSFRPGCPPISPPSADGIQFVASGTTSSRQRGCNSRIDMTVPTSRKRTATPSKRPPRRATQAAIKEILKHLPAARSKPLPTRLEPQLATLVRQAPEGDQWLSEIKFDGYRMICRIQRDRISFSSRNHLDWTERLKSLVTAVGRLGLENTILDGEVVTVEPDGTTSFQSLQNAFREGRGDQLTYYVFDVLYLAGHDLTQLPLVQRKRILSKLLAGQKGPLRYSEHVVGQAPEFFRQACKRRLEGIVCKRGDQPYRPGRGTDWVKVKCSHREEFVIGGYTPPAGSRRGFGALLVGYFNSHGPTGLRRPRRHGF